jgi:hypothetical protein
MATFVSVPTMFGTSTKVPARDLFPHEGFVVPNCMNVLVVSKHRYRDASWLGSGKCRPKHASHFLGRLRRMEIAHRPNRGGEESCLKRGVISWSERSEVAEADRMVTRDVC